MSAESLERRELMTVDPSFALCDVGLLHDTGSSGADRISANPTIAGNLQGEWTGLRAFVQFDHDGDARLDGEVEVEPGAMTFAYDPRDSEASPRALVGPIDVGYRGVLRDSGGNPVWTGDWASFVFTAEPPPAAPWEFQSLGLEMDTGSSASDGITTVPILVGRVRAIGSNPPLGGGNGGSGGSGGSSGGGSEGGGDLSGSGGGSGSDGGSSGGDWGGDEPDGPAGGRSAGGDSGDSGSTGGAGDGDSGAGTGGAGGFGDQGGTRTGGSSGWTGSLGALDERFVAGSELPSAVAWAPTDRAAVEWDTDADGDVDARTWLHGEAAFTFEPRGLEYGPQTMNARVLIWDSEYGVALESAWTTIAWTLIPEPAARVAELSLARDTGADEHDGVTSDPTIEGRLDGPASAGAAVYFDWDGDGVCDATTSADGDGRFVQRPLGLPEGGHSVHVRSSRWDDRAQADVFGEWAVLDFNYAPEIPPDVVDLTLDASSRDGGSPSQTRVSLAGRIEQPLEGIAVEFDDDGDGVPDAYTLTDASGRFTRGVSSAHAGARAVAVRAAAWGAWDRTIRSSDWNLFSYTITAADRLSANLASLGLARDTGDRPDDRVTSDPTLMGRVEARALSDANEVGAVVEDAVAWVDVDRDADGAADDRYAADGDGGFAIPMRDADLGQQSVRVRAAAWDERSQSAVVGAWTEFAFTFEADRVAAPAVAMMRLLADTGTDANDRRTATTWITGQLDGHGPLVGSYDDTFVEWDLNADDEPDGFVVPDATGRFTYHAATETRGPVSVRARAARFDAAGERYVLGDWTALDFVYEAHADEPARIVDPTAIVSAAGARIVSGRIVNEGTLANVRIEIDADGDAAIDATGITREDGQFEITLPAPLTGDSVVRMRTTEVKLTGETLRGGWTTLNVPLFELEVPVVLPSAAASDRVLSLALSRDTGASSTDRATSDASIAGAIDGAVLGGRIVEIDRDGDDGADTTVATGSDGTFRFDPGPMPEGVVSIAARLARAEGIEPSPWLRTRFVVSDDPDRPDIQELAASIRDYELTRESAVAAYWSAVDDAGRERHDAVTAAARDRNAARVADGTARSDGLRDADEAFHRAMAEAQTAFADAQRAAADRFATNMERLADRASPAVPLLVWPESPDAGRDSDADAPIPPPAPGRAAIEADAGRWRSVLTADAFEDPAADASNERNANDTLAAKRFDAKISDADSAFLERSQTARRHWEEQTRRAGRTYADSVESPHPDLDIDLEMTNYQAAVQRIQNNYDAAKRFHEGQHFTEVTRLAVKRQSDLDAAQLKFDREMDRLNNTPGGGSGDYYRTHLAWRRQIHWDRFTEIAQAKRDYSEGIAKANELLATRNAFALARRDRGLRAAESLFLAKRIEFEAWDQHRRIDAWQALTRSLASSDAEYAEQQAVAEFTRESRMSDARRARAGSAAEGRQTYFERIVDAMRSLFSQRRERMPEVITADFDRQLADLRTAAETETAELLADLERRTAEAEWIRRSDEGRAELDFAATTARATMRREHGYSASEADRMRAILDAATLEARDELAARFALYGDVIDARLDRDIARADRQSEWDMSRAEIDFDLAVGERDVRLDYMFQYHATPIEVPLAELARQHRYRCATATHVYQQAAIGVEESYSDRDVEETVEYELKAHGANAVRALATADADRAAARGTSRATAAFEVAASDADGARRVGMSQAENEWIRFLSRLESDRDNGLARIDDELALAESELVSEHRARLAAEHVRWVAAWASDALVPTAWARYHDAVARAEESRTIADGASETAWVAAWTSADQRRVADRGAADSARTSDGVAAYATLVSDVASLHMQRIRGYESAYVASGDDVADATFGFYTAGVQADRQYLDIESTAEGIHEEAVRDAQFQLRREASHIFLARNLDTITDDEQWSLIREAMRAQRVKEGDAFVALAQSIAPAQEAHDAATSAAAVLHVDRWSGAAERLTGAYLQADEADARAQLAAWHQMHFESDRAESAFRTRLAEIDANWNIDVGHAASARHRADVDTEFTSQLAIGHASGTLLVDRFHAFAERKEAAADRLAAQSDRHLEKGLLDYQAAVARLDAQHAEDVRDAADRMSAARFAAERALNDERNRADEAWIVARADADTQLATRVAAAESHHARDRRQAFGMHVEDRIVSEGGAERSTAAAQSGRQRAVIRADHAFETAVAAANRDWTIRAAEARAALHVAGETMDGAGGLDEGSLTTAQRAYLAAIRAADRAYAAAAKAAAVVRAGSTGDAWIDLHTALGAATKHHAARMAGADQRLDFQWNAAATAFTILATSAARDHADQIAASDAALESAHAGGVVAWTNATSGAWEDYRHAVGLADVVHARETAREEVDYHVATAGTASESDRVRRAWLMSVGPSYVRLREQTANAKAYADDQIASAAGNRDITIAVAEASRVERAGQAKSDFTHAVVGAYITHQVATATEDGRLMGLAVRADGPLKDAYADAVASHDMEVATAGKALLVADAMAYPAPASPDDERAYRTAVADAVRRLEVAKADADLQHQTILIGGESFHTWTSVAAAADLRRGIEDAEHAYRSILAVSDESRVNDEAHARASFAKDETAANNDYRRLTAAAHVRWMADLRRANVVTLTDFAADHPSTWTRYHAGLAVVEERIEIADQPAYLAWIDGVNRIESKYTLDASGAFERMIEGVADADTSRAIASSAAEHARSASETSARVGYAQYLGNPAGFLDQAIAEAEHDYRVAVANAERDLAVSGSREAYDRALADAAARRSAAVNAARRVYDAAESTAGSALRTAMSNAQSQWRLDRQSADASWGGSVSDSLGRFDAAVALAAAARSSAIAMLDADYQQARAAARESAFSAWSAQDGSPWAIRDADLASASVPLTASIGAAQTSRWSARTRVDDRWADSEQRASAAFLTAQSSANATFAGRSGAARVGLLTSQADADRQLVSTGHAALSGGSVWTENAGNIGWILPGGSFLFGSMPLLGGALMDRIETLQSIAAYFPHPSGPDEGGRIDLGPAPIGPSPSAGPSVWTPAQRPVFVAPNRAFRPESMDAAAMMRLGLQTTPPPAGKIQTKSGLQWFLDDLGLMARYPTASLQGAGEGLVTSGKVFVNGTATTLKSAVTLGFQDSPWELLEVTEADRMVGYDAAFGILRISEELLIGAATGRMAKPGKGPWLQTLAKGAFYYDMAQNGAGIVRGGYGAWYGDGLTLDNSIELLGGMAGLSGNVLGSFRHADAIVPAIDDGILNHKIGIGVSLHGYDDKIGHAFVVFQRPRGNRFAVGFYPATDFRPGVPRDLAKFVFGGNRFGIPAEIASDTDRLCRMALRRGWTRMVMYDVTESGFQKALQSVRATVKATREGTQRYHMFSQCAVFSRETLRAIGVRPFVRWAYPPYMYFRMWLRG
ncbi:MAG: hypothetical protein FJ297_15245 [Planctomycetes bacterium]|nr:hypothetical protein [Planctomycetota bacterium]